MRQTRRSFGRKITTPAKTLGAVNQSRARRAREGPAALSYGSMHLKTRDPHGRARRKSDSVSLSYALAIIASAFKHDHVPNESPPLAICAHGKDPFRK
jgi:hypothetical protein